MAYKVIILYQLYMPSYFLGTFTEYPFICHLFTECPYIASYENDYIIWCISILKFFVLT